ncbi:MAG: hypothetical protein EBT22_11655, partial [Chloroflexi bacterium]|nr:hypothetical protein [Chloroflexota bacterium]
MARNVNVAHGGFGETGSTVPAKAWHATSTWRTEDLVRLARRILTWGIAVLGAVVIGLVGSVVFDYAVGGDRLSAVTNVTIPGAGGSPAVRAYVARPTGTGPRPVVIMIHEFYGLNSSIVGKADLLAKDGYIVVAPDTMRGQTTEWIPRAIYQTLTTRPEDINADL